MSKNKTRYDCQSCGSTYHKWAGQCPDCQAWNTLVESKTPEAPTAFKNYSGEISQVKLLSEVQEVHEKNLQTGMTELDRVLGGGLVLGSVVLIGGDPGIGKSTLLLQCVSRLSESHSVLYVTGEESLHQVCLRANRLGVEVQNIHALAEVEVEPILNHAEEQKPKVIVIDSIQTVFSRALGSAPGSVSQVREAAAQFVRYAKQTQTALFLVGHVTKEGALAGPRVLEHMVDVVLYFEGQTDNRYRMLRAIKNRFGAVNELGIFAMTEKGLKEVNSPSSIFLTGARAAGTTVVAIWEGTRPLLVEIQALVDEAQAMPPKRVTLGLEFQRLSLLLAVLHRHARIGVSGQDVFVNVVGGVRITETAADLAVLFSVVSSLRDKPMFEKMMVFGEVGLGGEIRPVPYGQERLKEAAKHGFEIAIVPEANAPKKPIPGMQVFGAGTITDALRFAFQAKRETASIPTANYA